MREGWWRRRRRRAGVKKKLGQLGQSTSKSRGSTGILGSGERDCSVVGESICGVKTSDSDTHASKTRGWMGGICVDGWPTRELIEKMARDRGEIQCDNTEIPRDIGANNGNPKLLNLAREMTKR